MSTNIIEKIQDFPLGLYLTGALASFPVAAGVDTMLRAGGQHSYLYQHPESAILPIIAGAACSVAGALGSILVIENNYRGFDRAVESYAKSVAHSIKMSGPHRESYMKYLAGIEREKAFSAARRQDEKEHMAENLFRIKI